jgi:hypothetical protein
MFDDDALIALTSKGLLRRAVKDLEKENVAIEASGAIRVGTERVTLDDRGPKYARCTCPAQEICRHILTAILFLRQRSTEPKVDPAALESELLAIDLKSLEKWAGKRLLREGIAVLAADPDPEIEVGESVRVAFPDAMVEARWFLGAGLDGAVTTSKTDDAKKFVVALVLAFQQSRGRTHELEAGSSAPRESGGAPRTRTEVLASARALFEEMIDAGLAHLTEAIEARLTTLSISAIGVNLPRLAHELKRIADEVALFVARRAQADEARMFANLSRGYALAAALGHSDRAELIGQHRTRYREVGTLELAGLGAYPWRSGAGYFGLTLVFLELKSGQWHAWTDARPVAYAEYSPEERYRALGPWEGMRNPALASRSRFLLFHPQRNEKKRLSGTAKSRAQVIGPIDPEDLELGNRAFDDFDRLREHFLSQRPAGLGAYDPLSDLAIVKPARFGERSFDEVRQTFRFELFDANQRMVPMSIEHQPDTAAIIEALEQVDPKEVWGVLGRVHLAKGELALRPISLYSAEGIHNLGLDGVDPKEIEATASAPPIEEQEEERAPEAPIDSASLHRIRSFESMLEELAEIGRGALDERRRRDLTAASQSLERAGLSILAGAARALSTAGATDVAGRVLRGRFLTAVHRELSA